MFKKFNRYKSHSKINIGVKNTEIYTESTFVQILQRKMRNLGE